MNLGQLVRFTKDLLDLPVVTIRMSGDKASHDLFRLYTQPHPRYRLIRRLEWGVALIPLPDTFEGYLQGQSKATLRKTRNRALRAGYTFASFRPVDRLDEVMAIHGSTSQRQGRPIHPDYLDRALVQAYFANVEGSGQAYGIFDAQGVLKAYANVVLSGSISAPNRLLGHDDDLDNGIMYLLVSEIVREMIALRQRRGCPSWIHYGSWFGGADGIRYFKKLLGFVPYRVRWVWEAGAVSERHSA